jgi:hypothetical protein
LIRCIVKAGVESFRVGGRHYRTGDLVELPDHFPIKNYPFLEVIQGDVEEYRRPSPITVRPLMIIMSVRRIPEVSTAFRKLNFIDKVYFRNFTPAEISDKINEYLEDHGRKYTHVLISSDDITPSPGNVRQLIQDVRTYDLPCVAGYCNICYFDRQDKHGMICGNCQDNAPHKNTNVTFDPVDSNNLSKGAYKFVTTEWASDHPGIYRVWFQGMACGMVSMKTHKKISFRSLLDGVGGLMQDLAFAVDCDSHGIKQFVDFRVGMRHYGTHHGKMLVGKEPTRIDFKKREA